MTLIVGRGTLNEESGAMVGIFGPLSVVSFPAVHPFSLRGSAEIAVPEGGFREPAL